MSRESRDAGHVERRRCLHAPQGRLPDGVGATCTGIAFCPGLSAFEGSFAPQAPSGEPRRIAGAVRMPVSVRTGNGHGHAREVVVEPIGRFIRAEGGRTAPSLPARRSIGSVPGNPPSAGGPLEKGLTAWARLPADPGTPVRPRPLPEPEWLEREGGWRTPWPDPDPATCSQWLTSPEKIFFLTTRSRSGFVKSNFIAHSPGISRWMRTP